MTKAETVRQDGGFSAAGKVLLTFCGFYVLSDLLLFLVLPLEGRMRPLWYAVQMAVGLAALSAAALLSAAKRSRLSPLLRELAGGETVVLLLWMIWAGIACLLAVKAGAASLRQNVPCLFDLFVCTLLLFPLGVFWGKRRDMRLLNVMIDAGGTVFLLFSLAAIFSRVTGREPFLLFGHSYGVNDLGRLAVGTNPNTTGAMAAFFLAAGLYRLHSVSSAGGKLCWGLAWGVNALTLYWSDCRTGLVAAGAAAAVYLFMLLWRSTKSTAAKVLLCTAAAGLLAGAGFFLWQFLKTHGADLQARGGSIIKLGSRTKIWAAVIKALKSDRSLLLRGCSPASVLDYVTGLGATFYTKVNTHNQFLEILTGQGLPGLALYVSWLLPVIWKSLKLLFSGEGRGGWILPLILFVLFTENLTEATLVCEHHYTGCLFFLTAGFVCGLAKNTDLKRR